MTVNKFIRNLLNLKELSVTHVELHARKRTLGLWVKLIKMAVCVHSAIAVAALCALWMSAGYGVISPYTDVR